MQISNDSRLTLIVAMLMLGSGVATAKDIYIAQNLAGANDGTSCPNANALSFFNSASNWGAGASQIGPGTTVHLCGTLTGTAGANPFLQFQGSGTSGSPITLRWETGAIVQAPYFTDGIDAVSKSYITLDGGTNGILQNTANGDSLTYRQPSTMIVATGCSHCTVQNLTILNNYVHIAGSPDTNIDQTAVRAIQMSGPNWLVTNNTIHDCGWCVEDFYGVGDTQVEIRLNNIYNFDHGIIVAPGTSTSTLSFALIHDNQIHDAANWDCTNLGCHHDGMHFFASSSDSNTTSDLYVYNNYFYGSWGTTATGFIFVEGAASPAHVTTSYWWNNVGIVQNVAESNGGWIGIYSGSTSTLFVNNTLISGGAFTDGGGNSITNCYNLGYLSMPVKFKNNVGTECSGMISGYNATAAPADWNYNYYGLTCSALQTYNNCFAYNSSGFLGSFSAWKATTGWDANSVANATSPVNPAAFALWTASGAPVTGNPAIGAGVNLSGIATGYLASLAYDTTLGGTRTPVARPSSGPWDIGAYAFSQVAPSPPTGLACIVR